jgi:hypothetical protein
MNFVTGIILFVLGFGLALFLIQFIHITDAEDLALNNNPDVVAGVNETCMSKTFEIKCAEGLECVLISSYPYKNGICMKVGTILEEDLTNRPATVGYVENK